MRYLRDTSNYRVIYTREDNKLIYFVSSDYIRDLNMRRSTINYIFTLGGVVISWRSMFQFTVTLFTTKAEYMVMVECA